MITHATITTNPVECLTHVPHSTYSDIPPCTPEPAPPPTPKKKDYAKAAARTMDKSDNRPMILLPYEDAETIPFFEQLGAAVSQSNLIFRKNDVVVHVFTGDAQIKLTYLNQITICEALERACQLIRLTKPVIPDGEKKKKIAMKCCLPDRLAKKAVESLAFRSKLREIRMIENVRLPVIRNETLFLLPTGYDAESLIWTADTVPYEINMNLAAAVAWLQEYFGQFQFADDGRSLSVLIALAISEYVKYILPPGTLRCAVATQANAKGAGKTIALKMALGPVHGPVPATAWPRNGDELRKKIAGAFASGDRIIVFDNVKCVLDSDVLEGVITSPVWQDRVLGLTSQTRWRHESQICMSGNNMKVGSDMMRRLLVCDLRQTAERPEERRVARPFTESSLAKTRPQFLAALYAMTKNWLQAGMPDGPTIRAGFEEWSALIGGIVTAAGFADPMAIVRHTDLDSELNDIREIIQAMATGNCGSTGKPAQNAQTGVTPEHIREYMLAEGLFEDRLAAALTNQARGSVVGRILQSWKDRDCAGYRLKHDNRTGARRKYWVEPVSNCRPPQSAAVPTHSS